MHEVKISSKVFDGLEWISLALFMRLLAQMFPRVRIRQIICCGTFLAPTNGVLWLLFQMFVGLSRKQRVSANLVQIDAWTAEDLTGLI